MTISVAVAGASGRMGTLIQQIIGDTEGLEFHAGLTSESSREEMIGADVLIDVTRIDVSEKNVEFALDHGINVVVGTSGWGQERLADLERRIPEGRGVIVVPNFSVGSVLGTHLATIAGRFYDSIEILEAHHEKKIDSPSGTAVRTAEAISAARGSEPIAPNADQVARGQVVAGIPIHALRLRGVVADQQVIFGGTGETITVRHETFSNTAYTHGIQLALKAAPGASGLTVGIDRLLGIGEVK